MSKAKERMQAKLKQTNSQKEKRAQEWSDQCAKALDNKQYENAVEFGKKALELLPLHLVSKTKCLVLQHMGFAYQHFNEPEAIRCFETAEKEMETLLTPAVFSAMQSQSLIQNLILQKAATQLALKDFKGALSSAQKLNENAKKIFTLQVQLNDKSTSIDEIYNESTLIKTNDSKELINLKLLQTLIYAHQGNTKMVKNSIKDLSEMNTTSRIEDLIIKCIRGFRVGGKFNEGLDFLNYAKKNFPAVESHNHYSGLYDLFIINENAGNYDLATGYLTKLRALSNLGIEAKGTIKLANTVRFYTELENKNFDKARKILKDTDLKSAAHKKLITKLEQDSAKVMTPISEVKVDNNILSNAIIEAEEDNTTSSSSMESFDKKHVISPSSPSISKTEAEVKDKELVEIEAVDVYDFDPKKIHEYFKHKKSLLSKKDSGVTKEKSSSWVLPNGTKYDSKQTELVHKIEGRDHYYICIKNNLKLGTAFIEAMKKGVVSKSYSSTGIKFFKNSDSVECVELKINGGDRAWSKTMYMNPEGDYLVVIDGYGNHTAAGKATRAGMEIISTPSYSSASKIATSETGICSEGGHYYTTTLSSEYKDHADMPHDDLELMGDDAV